jgi:hypothetical protein
MCGHGLNRKSTKLQKRFSKKRNNLAEFAGDTPRHRLADMAGAGLGSGFGSVIRRCQLECPGISLSRRRAAGGISALTPAARA